ncbi:MAG: hypothetical protein ACN2B6_12595 [Rickettsiales bacterium]
MNIPVDRLNLDSDAPPPHSEGLFVTIFTDASVCHNTKAYGCALWAKAGKSAKPFQKAWGGRGCKGSSYAELEALEGAVWYALNEIDCTGMVVVIQSDCIGALNKLDISALRSKAKYVKLKHVKAHVGKRTNRSKVNDIVDQMARRAMQRWRKKS